MSIDEDFQCHDVAPLATSSAPIWCNASTPTSSKAHSDSNTLRANAVSIVGFLPGRANAELVAEVLSTDAKVRRLCVASEVSRLMQWEWTTALAR